ncbi:MAG: acyl-CoA/acyl-ACP dehydrogenase [Desulfobacterales bacterium]|nr:MAG: acyl-CoA/acyl-ACP dehydrogenase [Desulfobacterales bacterium]
MSLPENEYLKFRNDCFHYLWDNIGPLANEIEKTGRFPRKRFWEKFGEMGLLGLTVPREYGGMGLSETQYIPFEKEWAKIHGSLRGLLHFHNSTNDMFIKATEKQRRRYWPKLARGEMAGAFALTEPDGGSGKDIKSKAVRKGENLILNGRKHFTTGADFADIFHVICWTELEPEKFEISNLLVERKTEGFIIGDMAETMGVRGLYHGRLSFNDCIVPATNIVGEEGKGLEAALSMLSNSRLRVAATALGVMERCLDLAIEYAKQRVTFGKPIAERQAIQRYLAEIAQDIFALQCAIDRTAKLADEDKDYSLEAELSKLIAIDAERRTTDNALLVFGGLGYVREYPIEILYRDARINWIEEGTPTMHMLLAASKLLKGQRTYVRFHDEVVENPVKRHIRLAKEIAGLD